MAATWLAIASLLLLALDAARPAGETDLPLPAGSRRVGELASGETHAYGVRLEAGQFLRLTVVQRGVDVVVTVTPPHGGPREVDVARGHHGQEPASLLADAPGRYRVEVSARPPAASGRYVIEAHAPRAAGEQDRLRLAAERALAEGAHLSRSGTATHGRVAASRLEEAVGAWRGLADPYWEAETLVLSGAAHLAVGDPAVAAERAAAAVTRWRSIGDAAGEARALQLAGQLHHAQGDRSTAIARWEEALARRRADDDGWGTAQTLTSLCLAYAEAGQTDRGLAAGGEALDLWRRIGDRGQEARALVHLGETRAHRAELQESVDLFLEALAIQRATGDRQGEAHTLSNVGYVQLALGNLRAAEDYLARAIPIASALGDRQAEATALNNLGFVYTQLGELASALERYEQSLRLRREIGDRRGEAYVLVNRAMLLRERGEFGKALESQWQGLRIIREVGDRPAEALALLNVGLSYADLHRWDEARAHLRQALQAKQALGDRSGQATALYFLARVDRDTGDLRAARAAIEEALEMIEGERRRVTTARLPQAHLASTQDKYELYVDVLMALHRQQPEAGLARAALHASERGRARALLDLLHEAKVDVRRGASTALLEEERTLADRLSQAVERQARAAGRATAAHAQEAAPGVEDLRTQLESVRARLRSANPRFAALDRPDPLTLERIQGELLDEGTVLLEYALGAKRSFLWVVGRTFLDTYELPARAVIEEATRAAYDQLSRRPGPRTAAGRGDDAVARLGRMVLGPAADRLRSPRLLVVPDGALHYVPFGALPHPAHAREPLAARHEVVAAPSASTVAVLREEWRRRRPAAKMLAILADPVFDREDERVGVGPEAPSRSRGAALSPSPHRELVEATRDLGLSATLPRLPFARREANEILALVPPHQRKVALDFEASRAAATDPDLAAYRIVHFATHGFYNDARPELSGLVLSLVNSRGEDERGFVTAADVFHLRLGADLVVLSGCRTALGRDIKGEGFGGLSRGFMYAGAPRVMASLWKVDDEATAALMARFYGEMLGPNRRTPATALRAAQASLRRERRWRAPYYWAAFQVQGDWR